MQWQCYDVSCNIPNHLAREEHIMLLFGNILLIALALGMTEICLAADKYVATVSWDFPAGSSTYEGAGGSRETAFENAKQLCLSSQAIEDYKNFCKNAPVAARYTIREDRGQAWTGWMEVGEGVGNPCQAGSSRGEQIREEIRVVGFPGLDQRPQTKHLFQCWGETRPAD